eukprot:15442725-Alexandrium_andersonii.AAC.1
MQSPGRDRGAGVGGAHVAAIKFCKTKPSEPCGLMFPQMSSATETLQAGHGHRSCFDVDVKLGAAAVQAAQDITEA